MTTITITTDDHTARQILDALNEAEEFGQVDEPFNVHTQIHDNPAHTPDQPQTANDPSIQ